MFLRFYLVEAGRTIIPVLGIRQIHLDRYLPIRNLGLRKVGSEAWCRTDKEAQQQSGSQSRHRRYGFHGGPNLKTPNYAHVVLHRTSIPFNQLFI